MMDEEEVWRAVVRWGQHKARVLHPFLLWSEDDRSLVRRALEGVLQHVQVMDIDSDVFAKEVEPTGLLPMDMMLERYRHAAIHQNTASVLTNGRSAESPRRGVCDAVRVTREPFAESAILNGKLDWQWDVQDW